MAAAMLVAAPLLKAKAISISTTAIQVDGAPTTVSHEPDAGHAIADRREGGARLVGAGEALEAPAEQADDHGAAIEALRQPSETENAHIDGASNGQSMPLRLRPRSPCGRA